MTAVAAPPLSPTLANVVSDTGHTWPKSGGHEAAARDHGEGGVGCSVGAGGAAGPTRRRRTSHDKSIGATTMQGLFSGEGTGVLPRVLDSGKEAWRKAAATVAAVGGGSDTEGGAGRPATRAARGNGGGGGARRNRKSRRRGSRGMADDGEREGSEPGEKEQSEEEEEGEGEDENEEGRGEGARGRGKRRRERPPFLSFTVGGVSGFLPDVRWSVQMQHKRFLRIEDSGSVRWVRLLCGQVLGAHPPAQNCCCR